MFANNYFVVEFPQVSLKIPENIYSDFISAPPSTLIISVLWLPFRRSNWHCIFKLNIVLRSSEMIALLGSRYIQGRGSQHGVHG